MERTTLTPRSTTAVVDSVDATVIDEALRRARAADRGAYHYTGGRDRTAEAAVDAAARDGVRRCQCPHCRAYRAQHALAEALR